MRREEHDAVVDLLSRYDRVVEIGIGNRCAVAAALAARGTTVTATDVHHRTTPPDVVFVRDDVTNPTDSVYAETDAIYALNLPSELHRPTHDVAKTHDADFCFTTLGFDHPTVPARPVTILGETIFFAQDRPTTDRG